jgi:hypothetical protein
LCECLEVDAGIEQKRYPQTKWFDVRWRNGSRRLKRVQYRAEATRKELNLVWSGGSCLGKRCYEYFIFLVLGFELKALHLLGRHSTIWAIQPVPQIFFEIIRSKGTILEKLGSGLRISVTCSMKSVYEGGLASLLMGSWFDNSKDRIRRIKWKSGLSWVKLSCLLRPYAYNLLSNVAK